MARSGAINEALESTETVVAKLNKGYIPKVLAAYVDKADDRTAPKIEASSPKQSQLLLIKSKAPEKESELHVNLHKKVSLSRFASTRASWARLS